MSALHEFSFDLIVVNTKQSPKARTSGDLHSKTVHQVGLSFLAAACFKSCCLLLWFLTRSVISLVQS